MVGRKVIYFAMILMLIFTICGCKDDNTININKYYRKEIYTGEVEEMSFSARGVFLYELGKRFLGKDVFFGEIITAEDAAKIAESVWIQMYGEQIVEYRPYQVGYSEVQNTWIVYNGKQWGEGSLKCYLKKDTGKLLAVYYDVGEEYDKSNWIEYPVGVDETGMMYDDVGEFYAVLLSESYSNSLFEIADDGRIESFNAEKIFHGRVDTALEVINVVEKELTDFYGAEYMANQRPYLVKFDPETKIWMIMGNVSNEAPDITVLGGGDGLTALVYQENGEILSAWQGD